jgi:anaerobic selenocysteine-containing dehydrogenase
MSLLTDAVVRTHYRACNLCEAICGLEITLDKDDQILTIKGDEKDPLSRGHICPKAVALKDIYTDPNRLKQPIKKTADGWKIISWEEAFIEVVSNIKRIQNEYGKNGIAVYTGNPAVHNSGTLLTGPGLLKALGTQNRYSATSADQLPHHFVSLAMFGHHMTLPIPDIDRTDYFVIMGGNPLASNGSMMTVPNVAHRIKNIQNRGGKVVVVDPRKTETSKIADQHIFIKPGTDALFLLAILHEIVWDVKFGNNAIFLEEDFEEFNQFLQNYSPKKVSAMIGVLEADIKTLAAELMKAKTAVVYGRMGLSTQEFGGICQWLINLINIFNNNFDKPGGAMFTDPAFSLYGSAKKGYKATGRFFSKVRNLPEFEGELPVSALAEEILHPEGPKALITICGNPVLSTSNGVQLEKALETLDYIVAVDIYLNETTSHANIILPPTTGLEVSHYDLVFHQLAVRNTSKYSEPLYPKSVDQRHDWEILEELKNRLITPENEPIPAPQNPEFKIDFMLKNGKYGDTGLDIEALKAKPSGIDLGVLKPSLKDKIYTNNGKINYFPSVLMEDLKRLNSFVKTNLAQDKSQILLIGRRHLRSNNSWMHNSYRLVKGNNRCTLMIHPATAKECNIMANSEVKVTSRVGAVVIPVEITEDIMPNVVSIPHGYGHTRKGSKLDIASQHAGVSINDLTDELLIDTLTGNAAFSGVPVTLEVHT